MSFIKCLIILVLSTHISFAQKEMSKQMDAILKNNNENPQKIEQLQNLLNQFKNSTTTPETGIVYNELAKILFKNSQNDKAINSLKKSIRILEKHKRTHLFELNRSRNNLAYIYMTEERVNEQYLLLKQIINDKGNDENTFNALNNAAIIESKRGDYYSGLNRLNLLLTTKHTIENELMVRINIIKIYAIMIESYSSDKFKKHKQIIQIHQNKIETSFHKTTLNEVVLYSFYNNLANIYESLEEYDTALQLYLKSKKYYTDQNETSKALDVTNNIGYLYAKQKKTKRAIECFQTIINTSDDINQIAAAYNNMGYFLDVKSTQKIPYLQKSLQVILEKNEPNFTLPSLDSIRDSGCQQEILVYLVDLAYHYVESYKETNNSNYLWRAKETLYRIDELVSLIRYESNTEQSKLFWIEKGVNTYMLAVEVCYLLNKPDEGFYFMEKNKALLLQENIKMFQAKLELEIPKKLREREYKLHYELVALEKKFQSNPNSISLKKSLNKKNKEFQLFIDSLSVKYPKYSKIKQKIETLTLNKALSTISKKECFVTYILNQEDGYGIFCSNQEQLFFKIKSVPEVQKNVKMVKNYMSKRVLDKAKTTDFQAINYKVFKSLFPFSDAITKLKNKKIIIVPDDALLNLPFEALVTHPTNKLTDSYLINTTEISYIQSFSVFERIKQRKNQPQKNLLAISPNQFDDKSLQTLNSSNKAIQTLNKYSSSNVLLEEEATKENFYKFRNEYAILHLNTHGGVDALTESPWIAFRNNRLTLDELYGLDNQAELVILDACKTNDGNLATGEGIISLSRGFFNTGSKSVLASLWNVNEKAGNEIISSFYNELENGSSKSKALQSAKIKYLKEHQFSEVLPYYWASFTLTGSTTPIDITESWLHGKQLLLLISLFLILSFFFLYKRKFFKK